jgi:glycine/D-amino acid oxidase-like deaminating enzyme
MTAFFREGGREVSRPMVALAAPGSGSLRSPRVVIIGAGFAGLSAAKALAKAAVDVTVIDRRNYHLFQPLLYQVATAGLSPADVATPIRGILRKQRNTTVLLARVTGIDVAAHTVETDVKRIPYDLLIVATGARHAYLGGTNGRAWRRASRRSRTRPTSVAKSSAHSSVPKRVTIRWSAVGC